MTVHAHGVGEWRGGDAVLVSVRARVGLVVMLGAIGLGLAVVALLGPLATGVIEYHVTETLRNQSVGLDAVALFGVAPLSFLAAALVLRGHRAGPALALGIGAYTSYMSAQYVLGPEYERLPGNNELLFPLQLVLFALGWIVVVQAWPLVTVGMPARSGRRDLLVGRVVLPLLAFLAFFRYLPALVDWLSAEPRDTGYLAGPTFSWTIALLDLGVFLPVTVAVCVGLVRGAAWAPRALYLVVGWFALVGAAVAAMAIAMSVNHDPNASTGNTVFMTALGLAFVALAVGLLAPLVAREEPRRG